MSKGTAVVVGVGAETGLGAALARRFAREGLRVVIVGRTEKRLRATAAGIHEAGGTVLTKVTDATHEKDVVALFDKAAAESDLELVVYNAGNNVAASALETTSELFERLWRQNAFGGFLVGREAARRLASRQKGTILFTGATASLRARPPFIAFGCAKAALRAVAQGLAREFAPQGVHVAHVVIDGAIQGEYAAAEFPDYVRSKGEDGLLAVDAIADTYWALHRQARTAWTHELDLRPFKEPF
ncbi:MAG: SDR family NAD(P)-dependent oxidoreductase [Pseudomonadota bacterium]|nr:SDR family NAD(P)-dependent oxidoreductase [Pseudomonadota bacterium]